MKYYDLFPKTGLVAQYKGFILNRVDDFCAQYPAAIRQDILHEAVLLAINAEMVTVQSVGGVAQSTTVFGTETFAIAMSFPGSASSTGGVRVKIVSPTEAAVSSTADFLLPSNWVEKIAVSRGQRASLISNDAGTPPVTIVELTK